MGLFAYPTVLNKTSGARVHQDSLSGDEITPLKSYKRATKRQEREEFL
jgi:hypothetical protein